MTSNPQDIIQEIRTIVAEHYQKAEATPLLLSHLGKLLRDKKLWPPEGNADGSLKTFLESAGDPDIIVVRDPQARAYIAVTDPANRERVEGIIQSRTRSTTEGIDLNRLPKFLLRAFCVRQEAGKPVYLGKTMPHQYVLTEPSPEKADEFWRIEEKYRLPGVRIDSVEKLPDRFRRPLLQRLELWSADAGVKLNSLYLPQNRGTNALQRLLEAQPSDIVGKLLIPADIALLLSEHE